MNIEFNVQCSVFTVHLPWFTTNNKNKNRNDQNWTAAVAAAATAQRQMCVCSCPRITVDGFYQIICYYLCTILLSSKNIEKSSFFLLSCDVDGKVQITCFRLLTRNLLRTHVCVCVCLRLYVFVSLLLWTGTVIVDAACTLFLLRMIWLYKMLRTEWRKHKTKYENTDCAVMVLSRAVIWNGQDKIVLLFKSQSTTTTTTTKTPTTHNLQRQRTLERNRFFTLQFTLYTTNYYYSYSL